MLRPRIIPVLLLAASGAVKTRQFKARQYVGDPINALKVFNEKEVDEIVMVDIEATVAGRGPNFSWIRDLASECFMPMAYGGGIQSVAHAEQLFSLGVEKIILGTVAMERPGVVASIVRAAGAQSVAISLDVRRNWRGRNHVCVRSGTTDTGHDPVEAAKRIQDLGAGEIILQSIDRDGMSSGYDLDLIAKVSSAIQIPLVACGGAGKLEDFRAALGAGASAAAAGSYFVFFGKHRAVLITYPRPDEVASINDTAN